MSTYITSTKIKADESGRQSSPCSGTNEKRQISHPSCLSCRLCLVEQEQFHQSAIFLIHPIGHQQMRPQNRDESILKDRSPLPTCRPQSCDQLQLDRLGLSVHGLVQCLLQVGLPNTLLQIPENSCHQHDPHHNDPCHLHFDCLPQTKQLPLSPIKSNLESISSSDAVKISFTPIIFQRFYEPTFWWVLVTYKKCNSMQEKKNLKIQICKSQQHQNTAQKVVSLPNNNQHHRDHLPELLHVSIAQLPVIQVLVVVFDRINWGLGSHQNSFGQAKSNTNFSWTTSTFVCGEPSYHRNHC